MSSVRAEIKKSAKPDEQFEALSRATDMDEADSVWTAMEGESSFSA